MERDLYVDINDCLFLVEVFNKLSYGLRYESNVVLYDLDAKLQKEKDDSSWLISMNIELNSNLQI
jgi:hypothetical protein